MHYDPTPHASQLFSDELNQQIESLYQGKTHILRYTYSHECLV